MSNMYNPHNYGWTLFYPDLGVRSASFFFKTRREARKTAREIIDKCGPGTARAVKVGS